jgi:hypothetical protein
MCLPQLKIKLMPIVARMGEINSYKILVGKHGVERPLRRLIGIMEYNAEMDFREVQYEAEMLTTLLQLSAV